MPHTRSARLRALTEAADSRDMWQTHDTSTNAGWNDYQDWDLPGLTYQPDSLVWFPSEWATIDQPPFYADAELSMRAAANDSRGGDCEQASITEFCGLQQWYSAALQDMSSVSPAATTRPQLSTRVYHSDDGALLSEGNQAADHTRDSQSWSPEISRQTSSHSNRVSPDYASDTRINELPEELQEPPSSAEEDARINTARLDANKKQKIAHSVVEKNYRSRINNGMAELRHCVPSTVRGRSSQDAGRPAAEDASPNHISGKMAILSDAVQYVKSLESQNEALHGQLDVMRRRNTTLQKIALSKVDTHTPPTTVAIEEVDC